MSRTRPAARWLPPPPAPDGVAEALAAALRPAADQPGKAAVPLEVCRLLAARGIHDIERAKRFLRPDLAHVERPEAVADLARAADRLAAAVRGGERILVHGDYDVDGICSTSLITRVLRRLGGDVVPFIPDRIRDGYDLGPAGVARAREVEARVVLTCDCGTTALAPAAALRAAGVDVIITDHHLPGPELPAVYALVNPRRPDCPSVDKDLAAVGVAYKLGLAVCRRLEGDESMVHDLLDLVALATVADVAPLRGENRVFVREGLRRMARSTLVGLRALLRAARLDDRTLTAGRIGYTLAPRLNALGRLRQALRGVELLLTDDEATANAIARECEELNQERQGLDRAILDEAMAAVGRHDGDGPWGIVLHSTTWHPGVIGIVASRVVEATGRPAMLIAVTDGVGKGSGRSNGALDLHAALEACGDLLVKHGGHRAAAGLTIDPARIPAFAARFDAIARERLTPDDLVPRLRTDLELPFAAADATLERSFRHLEPFGVGNPGPVLVSRGVTVVGSPRRIGTDGVKFAVAGAAGPVEAVAWGLGPRSAMVRAGATLDLAYKLDLNAYRGSEVLQAVVQDLRPAGTADG